MAETVKDHLQNAFEDLGRDNFKRFKSKLCDREGKPRVRKGTIEKIEDAIDLSDLLVNTFTTTGAVSVTVEILKAIDCHKIANELLENTGETAAPAVPPAAPGAPSADPSAQFDEHFIDRHSPTLIQRVNNVDAILDVLQQRKVITDEDYDTIRAKDIKPQKMRALLGGPIKSAGTRGKDVLYEILLVKEKYLMDELKGK